MIEDRVLVGRRRREVQSALNGQNPTLQPGKRENIRGRNGIGNEHCQLVAVGDEAAMGTAGKKVNVTACFGGLRLIAG